jgi:hypothetical protein
MKLENYEVAHFRLLSDTKYDWGFLYSS